MKKLTTEWYAVTLVEVTISDNLCTTHSTNIALSNDRENVREIVNALNSEYHLSDEEAKDAEEITQHPRTYSGTKRFAISNLGPLFLKDVESYALYGLVLGRQNFKFQLPDDL